MYDIAIIGAGIVGAMTARELTKYNVSVCVLEKENDVALGATKANSAIVHAGFDAEPNSLKAKLNVLGSEMMPKTAKELGVNTAYVVNAFTVGDLTTNLIQPFWALPALTVFGCKFRKIFPYCAIACAIGFTVMTLYFYFWMH